MDKVFDIKTLVHAGLEVAVIGGLVIFFNRKLSKANIEILELKKRVEQLEQFAAMVQQMMGRGPPSSETPLPNPPKKSQQVTRPETTSKPFTQVPSTPQNLGVTATGTATVTVEDEGEPNEEELDRMLEEEYSQINCKDGVCEVPLKKE